LQYFRCAPKRFRAFLAVLLSIYTGGVGLMAQAPTGATVRAGDVRITGEGTSSTRIDQHSARAIIDWRSFSIGPNGEVIFVQPSANAATLNRVTGAQVSLILGKLDANGTVLLMNPNGIVFGGGAQVNVGSLIASTSNISDEHFLAGQLVFDQPGKPGVGILNRGSITAREGGLVALVAPHVRNDGLIAARLGKVTLASGDTFTVDLYGDALINLAISENNRGQLVGLNGEPVTSLITNTGRIETAGGQTVLMTARGAKNVLDNLINTSGTIRADKAVEQNGKILLLGEGGNVDVTGTLAATGASGGSIQVLGDRIHLGGNATLDASGASGGGSIQVGGAYQGKGDTYRSSETTVDVGASLLANATDSGNGGEVVVWSDGNTRFAGSVQAKGGANAGNGGRLEVSGKGTLDFLGMADASAPNGQAGSLLLDPAFLNIGSAEASTITRVLRTGTTTNLQADVDINVNSAVFGGDREQGGGLNMTAGNNINVNDFVVTNNGAINMTATQGTVNVAAGKAVFAGSAPITITTGGTLHTAPLVTSGALSLQSIAGSIAIDSFIDDHTGPVSIKAAGDVDINQPIVNMVNGSNLSVSAGQDVNVNGQVDGRGGAEGGAVSMTASRNLNVNQAIVTNNGAIALTATNGSLNTASGTPLVSGTGAMALTSRNDISTAAISAGSLAITSTAGSASINGIIDSATGATTINAATDVNINQAILNGQTGSPLAVNAGRDVNVNAVIDGRSGVAGGTVALTAARNLNVNDYIVTNNGAIGLTANGGTLAVVGGKGTFSGNAATTMRASGDLTTGAVSAGSLAATSSGGAVNVNGVIDGNTGRVDLTAASDVNVNQAVLNGRTGSSFNATSGRDVNVNALVDGRGGATGGAVTLQATRDVNINSAIVTNNGAIGITATNGAATMAPGTALVSGNQAITIDARGDVTMRGISGGSLSALSRYGSVNVAGVIDGNTGRVDLTAGRDVAFNAPVLNTRTGASLNAVAGQNIIVNAPIDGSAGTTGGAVNLTANQNVNVNAAIATHDAAIRLSAVNGTTNIASTAGLFAGTGAINVDALGSISTGVLSGGVMNVNSRGGSVNVTGQVAGNGGAMTISAANAVNVNSAVTNKGTASPLTITAGTDINVNAAVGRTAPGTPSGAVTLVAGQNVTLNDSIVAENAAINVTATNGTVTTAANEGLFAGTGNISVTAGQTLSTGATVTTGTVTLKSTGGDVDVNGEIAGATGAVTIQAANDVHVNQGIANSRTDAPLTITAGNDIDVNAKIDGRDDDPPTHASSATTLTAGNDVNLNQDIVTVDAALSLTATNGTVNWGAGTALFAGNGTISVTAGSDLTTGTTATTGALNLTSTSGNVNIATAIDDTTGNVAINAGQSVNINQEITNLKSGAALVVTAGTDVNIAAKVDGRNGTAAGGAVTMTAGNDVTLTSTIATNSGAVSLTATNGSVTIPTRIASDGVTPVDWTISTIDAPITMTSGGNFTLASSVKTSGAVNLTSTNGNVTIAAPITDDTGAVTITAGNGLIVNHDIKSNDQDITLNAGAGGIVVNSIVDYDGTFTSPVNSRGGNLTLNSVGNVSILDNRGISSLATVTIDTRGQIVTGSIGTSTASPSFGRPNIVNLNADGGIVTFNTGTVGELIATSSGGSINVIVGDSHGTTGKLRVTTGTPGTLDCPTCNITVTSGALFNAIGPDVALNAGGSIIMPTFSSTGTVDFIARSGDIDLQSLFVSNAFTANAGRDLLMHNKVWMGGDPNNQNIGGPMTLTAGRDILMVGDFPIHISNHQTLTLGANRNIDLALIETLGAVNLTATTGNITLSHDIGAHVFNPTAWPAFNPSDLGVATLSISAPSASSTINMQGARAEGNVVISTGGTLNAAKAITSVTGSVTITAPTQNLHQAIAIGTETQVDYPTFVAPAVPPGPTPPLPTDPGVAANLAAGLPAFAEIAVAPANQIVGGVALPGAAGGSIGIAGSAAGAGAPANTSSPARSSPSAATGTAAGQASGSSDPTALDTAAAVRAAGESCGEEQSGDTGLAAVEGSSGKSSEQSQKKAGCSSGSSGAAAAPTTNGTPAASGDSPAPQIVWSSPTGVSSKRPADLKRRIR